MNTLSLEDALRSACAEVGVSPPKHSPSPGRMTRTDTLGKNGKSDAVVLIFDDKRGGMVWNHQTAKSVRFTVQGASDIKRDPEAERRAREREERETHERRVVASICAAIVRGCRLDKHPYLQRKGFNEELGLICDEPEAFFPANRFGEMLTKAMPEGQGPFLIIPGRVGKVITTVQFITPEGTKKNILRGAMSGASHRIATGPQTWVCEGIGTALTVRAALRLLGAPVTVLSAFSASNVGVVAKDIPAALIAADHDKPVEGLEDQGAGEFYARRSGRKWIMPKLEGDDFNDLHQREGLRAVALRLREAIG